MSMLVLKTTFECANSPAFRSIGYRVLGKYLPLGTLSFLHTQAATDKQRKCFLDIDSNTSEELKPLAKLPHLERYFAPKVFRKPQRANAQNSSYLNFSLTF